MPAAAQATAEAKREGTSAAALLSARLDPGRLSWADLMRRVFAIDVLECPACGGRMRVIAAIEEPRVIRAILGSLGLSARPPPLARARPTPQLDLPLPDPA